MAMLDKAISTAEVLAAVPNISESPKERGKVEFIVVRPAEDKREFRDTVFLSPSRGISGDRWLTSSWLRLPDGEPDPRVQLSIMNARILKLIARTPAQVRLAGDNLIVDLDLSTENVAAGQKLALGEAIIQIADVPHTGCSKFMSRYGEDALRFVNSPQGKNLRLRGHYAQILQAGFVHVGDVISKI